MKMHQAFSTLRKILWHPSEQFVFVYKPFGLPCARSTLLASTSKTSHVEGQSGDLKQTALWLAANQFAPHHGSVGIPFPMLPEVRGMMCVTTSSKAFSIFDTILSLGLVRRTYVVVCAPRQTRNTSNRQTTLGQGERGLHRQRGKIDVVLTLQSLKEKLPARTLRLAKLFLPASDENTHPFIDASQLLEPKMEHHQYSMEANNTTDRPSTLEDRVVATYRVLNKSKKYTMFEVKLLSGSENGLLCALDMYDYPVVGDWRYNKEEYQAVWKAATTPSLQAHDKRALYKAMVSNEDDDFDAARRSGKVHEALLASYRVKHESQTLLPSPGLCMCCTGLEFPDPTHERNLVQLRHLRFHANQFPKFHKSILEKHLYSTWNREISSKEKSGNQSKSEEAVNIANSNQSGTSETITSTAEPDWKMFEITSPFPKFFSNIIAEDAVCVEKARDEYASSQDEISGTPDNTSDKQSPGSSDASKSPQNLLYSSRGVGDVAKLEDASLTFHPIGSIGSTTVPTRTLDWSGRKRSTCTLCHAAHHYSLCPHIIGAQNSSDFRNNKPGNKGKRSGNGSREPIPPVRHAGRTLPHFCVCCGVFGHSYLMCAQAKKDGCRVCGQLHLEENCISLKQPPASERTHYDVLGFPVRHTKKSKTSLYRELNEE